MLDRTVPPAFVPPAKFEIPQPTFYSLKGGNKLFCLAAGDQPVIKLEFIFKAGIRFEQKPGEAFFTAKMLKEGTLNFSANQISETLDRYGAFIEVSPGFDYTNISLHMPTEHLVKVTDVVAELLFEPFFPESELKLLQRIQKQQIKINNQKNSFVASRLFRSKLFAGSPYGHLLDEQSIDAINTSDLISFYKKWMGRKFEIFLTGQLDDSLIDLVLENFGSQLKPPHSFNDFGIQPASSFDEHIDKQDSLQSTIYLGSACENRNHKDYPGMLLLNEVFGGYFGSRLMQNIREDKGYTYSIYSHIASLRDQAYFVINSDVKKEFVMQAKSEIEKEVRHITSELIGDSELLRAKNHLKGSILNTLTNPFAITEKLKNIYLYELGGDFYDHIFDEIDRLNADDLLQIANNQIFKSTLSSVIVG